MEPVIDYAMKDYLNKNTFGLVMKQFVIRQCKAQGKSQSQALIVVNRELKREGYEPLTLAGVKHYW